MTWLVTNRSKRHHPYPLLWSCWLSTVKVDVHCTEGSVLAHLGDGEAELVETGEHGPLPTHEVHRLPGVVEPPEQLHRRLPVAQAGPLPGGVVAAAALPLRKAPKAAGDACDTEIHKQLPKQAATGKQMLTAESAISCSTYLLV